MQDEDQPSWDFNPEGAQSQPSLAPDSSESVSWTASEFIAHHKSAGWYLLVILGGAALTALVFLLTRDTISAIMIAVVAITAAALGARKPRVLNYSVDNRGITIGNKGYPYDLFKSFAIVDEESITSIYLVPLKRFMPAISIYYEPKDEERIVDVVGSYLPEEHHERDMIDKLMRKIRF